MSRAFVKEGDGPTSGSVTDRFYQGVLGLSDAARNLVARRQQEAWLQASDQIEDGRQVARDALGDDSYREIFEAAAERSGDPPRSPTWWATGDAAIALAARRRLGPEQFAVLVGPLGVALPWLKEAASQ
ncbi:MAG: hypothetical protein E6I84_05800 [Chloroflexi bacterium]|nr:MAG: hypothetical protein E6J32_09105 [Chloroflexota bacterium]TMD66352.1 MAG: hypothetical protein E6I84_05800 [Chloroflexota bacterium]